MNPPHAYLGGRWVTPKELSVSIFDVGFMMGATVTDRLRTFRGEPFQLEAHLNRVETSLEIVALDPGLSRDQLRSIVLEVAVRNAALIDDDDDLSIGLFITPGIDPTVAGAAPPKPLVCVHAYPLRFGAWARKYELGQRAVISNVVETPDRCLPPELKCRSRMHYYLADQRAEKQIPGARAILLNEAGFVAEATTASVVMYRHGEGLICPPRETILPGISLAVLRNLGAELDIPFNERPIRPEELLTADEIMFASTSVCLMPVISIGKQPIGNGSPGSVYRSLLAAWSESVGVDIAGQAQHFADRT